MLSNERKEGSCHTRQGGDNGTEVGRGWFGWIVFESTETKQNKLKQNKVKQNKAKRTKCLDCLSHLKISSVPSS
jgi:hypothetical protein